ncbi:MAG: HEAT repeat domain-containing protein [Candidatus Aminicenantes bacterium]|nr:HEAT repeat domain-containing protein [Candidatus Aminicenantes bacterium]
MIERFSFHKAENESSIPAYKDFIGKFPNADLAKTAELRIKKSAMAVLSRIKNPRKSTLLIDCLIHDKNRVKMSAARIMGEIRERRAVASLIQILNNRFVQKDVVWALGRIKDTKAVESLLSLLKRTRGPYDSKDKEVIDALGEIGDRRAVEPLLNILKKAQENNNTYIKRAATQALRKITGQKFKEEYEIWAAWWKKNKY